LLLPFCLLPALILVALFVHVPIVRAETIVGGLIITDTTWTTEGSPYIITQSVTVTQGIQLTIDPGVSVRFNSGLKLLVDGTLIARGTSSDPVTFTSNKPGPAAGDWGNIHFLGTATPTVVDDNGDYVSGSILQYCVVEYAGYALQNAVYSFENTLMVDNCLIENNTGSGIMIVSDPGTSSWVTNNTLRYNRSWGLGGGVLLYYGVIKNNLITNNMADGGQDGGGIYAMQADVIDNTVTFNRTKQTAGTEGGGILIETDGYGTVLVQGNLIQGNYGVTRGGGIYIKSNSSQAEIIVRDNVISENLATESGGGIYLLGSRGNVTIQDNIIAENIADSDNNDTGSGGGIFCDHRDGIHTIQNNIIIGNSAGESGGGVFTDGCPITENQITNNNAESAGGGVVSAGDVISNTISGNSLSGETATGTGVYLQGSGDFRYNSLTGNTALLDPLTGGLQITGTPSVHFNNIYGNEPYDVVVESSQEISGTQNYWGIYTEPEIQEQILDTHDEPSRGEFIYAPYLLEPVGELPLSPPTGLTATLAEDHIDLAWDPDPNFSEGWGYLVYYDTDSFWPPYEGSGLVEGDAPLDAGDQTTFTLSGIEAYIDYYIAVTVYDNEGRESWYAIVEVDQPGPPTPTFYLPLIRR
jgi:parallel beta-helix repeat protein